MRISPAVLLSSPAIMRRSVDLPQPEGPTTTTNSRPSIAMWTPRVICTAPKAVRPSPIATDAMNAPLDGVACGVHRPRLEAAFLPDEHREPRYSPYRERERESCKISRAGRTP